MGDTASCVEVSKNELFTTVIIQLKDVFNKTVVKQVYIFFLYVVLNTQLPIIMAGNLINSSFLICVQLYDYKY